MICYLFLILVLINSDVLLCNIGYHVMTLFMVLDAVYNFLLNQFI